MNRAPRVAGKTRTYVRDSVTEKEENNNENHGKHPRMWRSRREDARAVRTCAATADRAALVADGHLGYAVPIGGVVAYKNTISPAGVGFDIACGNKHESLLPRVALGGGPLPSRPFTF
jgi:RNA-splicing ligase RtcB